MKTRRRGLRCRRSEPPGPHHKGHEVIRNALLAFAIVLATMGVAHAQPQHLDVNDQLRGNGEPPEVILLTFGEGVQISRSTGTARCACTTRARRCHRLLPPAIEATFQAIADKAELPVGALPSITCFNYGVTNFRDGAAIGGTSCAGNKVLGRHRVDARHGRVLLGQDAAREAAGRGSRRVAAALAADARASAPHRVQAVLRYPGGAQVLHLRSLLR